jgi:hypothetical protein
MIQWGPRVLQGCPSLEEVVLQGILLQALTLVCICVINLDDTFAG